MKNRYKLFILPAIIIIIAGFFSGFSEQSYVQTAQNLLTERTEVLQKAYYGMIEADQAELYLNRIETYPLLSEDIGNLRNTDSTELDRVKSMEFLKIEQDSKLFPYVSLNVKIRWNMSGSDSDYISDIEYSVILKSTSSGYKLTKFDPK